MSTFDEIQFPTGISFESSGGPRRQTQIVIMGSGYEARNARWANSRREYDVGYGLKSMNDIHALITFFEARDGRLIGFRFKDWPDYKSCGPDDTPSATDQVIGIGAVTPMTFQLIKKYTSGSSSYTRVIKKPVAGSVLIAFNGVKQSVANYTVDSTTGLVTFLTPPGAGVSVSAGFQFDTPVRFDSDKLEINLSEWNAGKVQSCPLMEIFL